MISEAAVVEGDPLVQPPGGGLTCSSPITRSSPSSAKTALVMFCPPISDLLSKSLSTIRLVSRPRPSKEFELYDERTIFKFSTLP